jgi:hypothetical protein
VPVAPVAPESVTPESVETPVVEETGPISFTERTTFEELMSGRVIVETLRERGPYEYKNCYSVKRLDHDRLFYVFTAGGYWDRIPGQAELSKPPQPTSQIYYAGHDYAEDAPATTWTPPKSVESAPVEQPPVDRETIAERLAAAERRLAELKAALKEKEQ